MAKSINEKQFDSVLSAVRFDLKNRGWRKNRYRFNRRTDIDIIQVIQFELARSEPPGVVCVPPIRCDLSGKFTMEVGVYMELVDGPVEKRRFLSAWDCAIRFSPAELSDDYPDLWWDNDESVIADLSEFMLGSVYPSLDMLESTDLVLEHLPELVPRLRHGAGCPWRYLFCRAYVKRGNMDKAQEMFNAHWHDLSSRWPDSPQFKGLRDWALKHELTTPNKSLHPTASS